MIRCAKRSHADDGRPVDVYELQEQPNKNIEKENERTGHQADRSKVEKAVAHTSERGSTSTRPPAPTKKTIAATIGMNIALLTL